VELASSFEEHVLDPVGDSSYARSLVSRSYAVDRPAARHRGVWYFSDQDLEAVVQDVTTYLQFLEERD
jgi:hypothetical protein